MLTHPAARPENGAPTEENGHVPADGWLPGTPGHGGTAHVLPGGVRLRAPGDRAAPAGLGAATLPAARKGRAGDGGPGPVRPHGCGGVRRPGRSANGTGAHGPGPGLSQPQRRHYAGRRRQPGHQAAAAVRARGPEAGPSAGPGDGPPHVRLWPVGAGARLRRRQPAGHRHARPRRLAPERRKMLVHQRQMGQPRHRARHDPAAEPARTPLHLLHRADGRPERLVPRNGRQGGVAAILHRRRCTGWRRGAGSGHAGRRGRGFPGDGDDAERRPLVHRLAGAGLAGVRAGYLPQLCAGAPAV